MPARASIVSARASLARAGRRWRGEESTARALVYAARGSGHAKYAAHDGDSDRAPNSICRARGYCTPDCARAKMGKFAARRLFSAAIGDALRDSFLRWVAPPAWHGPAGLRFFSLQRKPDIFSFLRGTQIKGISYSKFS